MSSCAAIDTSPARSERFATRTKPCRPCASDADGNSGTPCTPSDSLSGAVDRFVRCPVGLDSRLMTASGASDSTASDHLPAPSPSDPDSPGAAPVSSSDAVYVRDAPAAISTDTSPPAAPRSSVPDTTAVAVTAPRFARRSRLSWFRLLPGLNTATRCAPSTSGAVSCIAVRNPSAVRMYDSASTSSALDSSRRQPPWPAPAPPDRPLPALPDSRSSELKCLVRPAPIDSVSGSERVPASSTATISTVPARGERLTIRAKPCRPCASDADGK